MRDYRQLVIRQYKQRIQGTLDQLRQNDDESYRKLVARIQQLRQHNRHQVAARLYQHNKPMVDGPSERPPHREARTTPCEQPE